MNYIFTILLVVIGFYTFAQEDSIKPKKNIFNFFKIDDDGLSDKSIAFSQINELHQEGAIIIRLMLHKKNADLYRAAGNTKLADKLEKDLIAKNKKIASAFLKPYFNFCPVYIIESKDYGRVINKETNGYFLNTNLDIDSSITLEEENFFFLQIGDVYESVALDDNSNTSEMTSSPIAFNVMYLSDKNNNQLINPFPFYSNFKSVTIDASSWVKVDNGKKYLGETFFRDSVIFNDKPIFIKTNSHYKNSNDKQLLKFIDRKINSNKFILKNNIIYSDKKEFLEYLKVKYKYSKKEAEFYSRIWEWQLKLYGFYSESNNLDK